MLTRRTKVLLTWSWALLLVSGGLTDAARAAEPAARNRQLEQAKKLTGNDLGLPISPRGLALLEAATSRSADELPRDISRPSRGPTRYHFLHLEFKDADACEAFDVSDTHVITRFGRFLDTFVAVDSQNLTLLSVLGADGLAWADVNPIELVPPPPRRLAEIEVPRQLPEPIVSGGADGLTGKGVVVAVVDSGIDFRHPDFVELDEDGKPVSRVLAFWDTTSDAYALGIGSKAPYTYPNGASIGTIYSRDDLTAELRSATPRIPTWDTNGHGTSCAGIAAGNGRMSQGEYAGVAPKADIVAVRISSKGAGMTNSYLLGAISEWLDRLAAERPLVVSCSFGGHYSGHDGYRIIERQLDARFSPEKVGRAMVFSAGNEGIAPIHAAVTIGSKNEPGELKFDCPREAWLTLYVDADSYDDMYVAPLSDNTRIKAQSAYVHGLTGQVVAEFSVLTDGEGGMYIYDESGDSYQADGYLLGGQFAKGTYTLEKLVGSPGNAANVVTVGSYDWNDEFSTHGQTLRFLDVQLDKPLAIGDLSTYSSPGPRRMDSRLKPEITAPGQFFTAPAPLNVPVFSVRDSHGHYQLFNGTSAATPYVAGVMALALERSPKATFGQLKSLLLKSASETKETGDVPNARWGHGKLDVAAIRTFLRRVGELP